MTTVGFDTGVSVDLDTGVSIDSLDTGVSVGNSDLGVGDKITVGEGVKGETTETVQLARDISNARIRM